MDGLRAYMADDLKAGGDVEVREAASSFLTFTAEELEIARAAADVLDGVTPLERLHRPDAADISADARRELGGLGWFALALPEAQGGSGLSAVELSLLFREAGRRCAPIDILAQCLAAMACANDPDTQARLIAGEVGAALAVRDGEQIRILGAIDARYAVLADRDRTTLIDLEGRRFESRPSLDPGTTMRLLLDVSSADVTPADGSASADPTHGAWLLGQVATAAMLVGVAEAALDLIVAYASIRETFGRKIGSYQAVRHPCADMAMRAEAARAQLWYASACLKAGRGDAAAHLDAAKHLANTAAVMNADVNIQLHGGIGITDEHDAHLLLKRGLLLSQVFGAKRALMARLLHADLQD